MNPSDGLINRYYKTRDSLEAILKRLKKRVPKDLDYRFQKLHDEVFEYTDCLTCANCCKTTSPMLFEKDIDRLAGALRMRIGDFVSQYLFLDKDGTYAMKETPCPFLGSDNYCSVYDDRPKACREFPHTNHRKMSIHLDLAEKNLTVCPAVMDIIEKLGKTL
jgi:uncharacterized protein